jgi:plastocyanin
VLKVAGYSLQLENVMNRRFVLKSLLAVSAALVLPFARSAQAATTHKVAIQGFAFSPTSLTVEIGDTIEFTNMDSAPHTATARDKSWNTKTLRKGKSALMEVTADTGKDYFCKFHPSMTANLKIS